MDTHSAIRDAHGSIQKTSQRLRGKRNDRAQDRFGVQTSREKDRQGGDRITKVVRAFSFDQRVSEQLDWVTAVPGISKPMNKSKYVNEALDFYMGTNIQEFIQENKDLQAFLSTATNNLAEARITIQGLKHDLADSLAKARPDCRCLWCRLMRRLQK